MLHEIVSAQSSQGDTVAGSFGGMPVNGVVIGSTAPFSDTDTLQVVLKGGPGGPEVLCNGVGLATLAGISDLRYGQSPGLVAMLVGLNADAAGGPTELNQLAYSLVVDLGMLRLPDTNGELEVSVRVGQSATIQWVVAGYFRADDVDYSRTYVATSDLRSRVEDCEAIYIVSDTDLANLQTRQADFLVQGSRGAMSASVMGLLAFNAAFEQVEAHAPMRVLEAYRSPDLLFEPVTYGLSGTDADKFLVVLQSRRINAERVARGIRGTVVDTLRRSQAMSPSKRQALEVAGVLPPAQVLRHSLDEVPDLTGDGVVDISDIGLYSERQAR